MTSWVGQPQLVERVEPSQDAAVRLHDGARRIAHGADQRQRRGRGAGAGRGRAPGGPHGPVPVAAAASRWRSARHAGSLLMLTGTPVNVIISEASADAGAGRVSATSSSRSVGLPLVVGVIAIVLLFGRPHAARAPPARSRHSRSWSSCSPVSAAAEMDVSPATVLMAVAVSAAASFLTPVATPANLMVMGPGGYRFGDYWKLGTADARALRHRRGSCSTPCSGHSDVTRQVPRRPG